MTNKERAKKIKKLIGFKRNKKILFSRPADIIADLMHYCDHYFDHESLDSKYDFENEFRIAKEYYERCKRLKTLSRSRFTKIEFCKHHIDRVSYKARY